MWNLKIFIFLIVATLLFDSVLCKKKKSKRPKQNQDDDPGVVTYSSFGLNDGMSQSDFKPSGLDMNSMTMNGPETTTMGLYAPAFPTSEDTTPFNLFANNGQVSQSFSPYLTNMGSNNQDAGKYHSFNFDYHSKLPGYENLNGQDNKVRDYDQYDQHAGDAPVYGTKINAKETTKKPSLYGDTLNYQSIYNYASTWPTTNVDNLEEMKPMSTSGYKDAYKSGHVSDFTNFKGSFQTDYNDNSYANPTVSQSSKDHFQNMKNTFSNNKFSFGHSSTNDDQKETFDFTDKDTFEPATVHILPNSYKNPSKNNLNYSDDKYNFKNTDLYSSYKDKYKIFNNKPHESPALSYNSLDFSGWKHSLKNIENQSEDNNKYSPDYSGMKTSITFPEYESSQSNIRNVIDFTGDNNPFKEAYQDNDFSSSNYSMFKLTDTKNQNNPNFNHVDYSNAHSWKPPKNKIPDENPTKTFSFDFTNPSQNSYFDSSVPTKTTLWGNAFKAYEDTSSQVHKIRKPGRFQDNDESDTIVHIPKKHQASKLSFGKFGTGKTIDEWNKEVTNRFKSEEELLGLRNHDTSHPSYLPTYKLKEELNGLPNYASNFDYKNAIEKWKYLHFKSKNPGTMDPYVSDSQGQSMNVPYPKPYQIEIPHPVIVPVPQPYPVRVPVPKPIAVPVVRELTIPIERPVPYPVIKKVPYPVEKPVPVPIEKPVAVPVMKPYPVPIPHVRPVFHHSRPRPPRDEDDSLGDPEMDIDEEFQFNTGEPISGEPMRGESTRWEHMRGEPTRWENTRGEPTRGEPMRGENIRGEHVREHMKKESLRGRKKEYLRNEALRGGSLRGERHRGEPYRGEPYRGEELRLRSTERVQIRPAKTRRTRIRPRRPPAQSRVYGRNPQRRPERRSPSTNHNYRRTSRPRGPQSTQQPPKSGSGRYAPTFKDHEEHDDHDHDDYFKYCQNNPLCYIQSLKMPVLN